MSLTSKQARFIDEYMADLNATQAAIRAGYSEKSAYSQGARLLKHVEIRAELARRMQTSKLEADDVIRALGAMAIGATPTKIVEGSHSREEYDMRSAMVDVGKVFALFHDKIDLDISHLNITDEEE